MLAEEIGTPASTPADAPTTPGKYSGSTLAASQAAPTPEITVDDAAAAADQVAVASAATGSSTGEQATNNDQGSTEQQQAGAELATAVQEPSAADTAAAPLTDSTTTTPTTTETTAGEDTLSSNNAIPVVAEGNVEVADGSSEAPERRTVQLAQRSSTAGDGAYEGQAVAQASLGGAPSSSSGGWSMGQMAGLAVGLIAAGCMAAVALVRYKRNRRAAQNRYTLYNSDIEMRGLI